jgi:hypothetical protein
MPSGDRVRVRVGNLTMTNHPIHMSWPIAFMVWCDLWQCRVNKKDFARQMKRMVPDYMAMGTAGMADMGEMEMPLPDNTLPMMTGFGQFGPIEMGGMSTVVKVREGLSVGDYKDPGWYQHPPAPPGRHVRNHRRRVMHNDRRISQC